MTAKASGVWTGSFEDVGGTLPNGTISRAFGIAYTVQGNAGPVVLMIHGFLTNRNEYFALQALMSPYCRTIAVDLLGMGDSTKLLTETFGSNGRVPTRGLRSASNTDLYSWDNDIEYLRSMMNALYPGERFLIIGDYWGSDIGFRYSSKYGEELFGVVNINATVGSKNRSMIERQIARWNRLSPEAFEHGVIPTFESTMSGALRSLTRSSCLWPDRCLQLFMAPYYNWKTVGGQEITYTSSTTVPVNVTTTIDSRTVGRGGVEEAVRSMTENVTTDIANDIIDDGRINSTNVLTDTAAVDPIVQQELNVSLDPRSAVSFDNANAGGLSARASLGGLSGTGLSGTGLSGTRQLNITGTGPIGSMISGSSGQIGSLPGSLPTGSAALGTTDAVFGSLAARTTPNTSVNGLPPNLTGTIARTRTSTTTAISSANIRSANVNINGATTDVSVPATIRVLKEIDVLTGGKRMIADVDEHAVRVLSERAASAYPERMMPFTSDNTEGVNYDAVRVPQMFISGCEGSLAVQGTGWKMLNELNVVVVRVVEIENAGHLIVVEKPKKIANIVLEFIINLLGRNVLARRFDGYDRKPATSMCSWVNDEMLSFTVVTST